MFFQSLLELDTNLLLQAQEMFPREYAPILVFSGESIVIWVMFVLIGTWLYGTKKNDNSYKEKSLQVFGLIMSVFIIYTIINIIVPQWRQHPSQWLHGMNIIPLIPHPTDNSFPSGHALFSTAAIFSIAWYIKNPLIITISIILGIITVCSRVIGGVHYPGDIIGGILFGIIGVYIFKNISYNLIQKISPFLIKVASYIKL